MCCFYNVKTSCSVPCTYVWSPVLGACAANSHKCPIATGCGHSRLVATVDNSSIDITYMRVVHPKESSIILKSWRSS